MEGEEKGKGEKKKRWQNDNNSQLIKKFCLGEMRKEFVWKREREREVERKREKDRNVEGMTQEEKQRES